MITCQEAKWFEEVDVFRGGGAKGIVTAYCETKNDAWMRILFDPKF